MKNKLYIKIITGYREDQFVSVPISEAHKAYFLFLNEDFRTIFSNGAAVRGQDVVGIKPDYHASMGWNHDYKLDPDDMNQIRREGVTRALRNAILMAKEVSEEVQNSGNKGLLKEPMDEAAQQLQVPTAQLLEPGE